MVARIVGLCALLTGFLFLSGCTKTDHEYVTQTEFKKGMEDLKTLIAGTQPRVPSTPSGSATQDPLARMQADLDEVKGNIDALTKLVQEKDVAASRKSLADLADLRAGIDAVKDQSDGQKRILDAIAGLDPNKKPLLRLNAIMQNSQEGKQEIAAAVNNSMPRQGTLRIDNRMATDQYLLVNGKSESIPAGKTVFLDVPVGTVVTELAGYEGPKSWMVGPPSYGQEIIIAPRPAPPVVMQPWPIVEPVIYVW